MNIRDFSLTITFIVLMLMPAIMMILWLIWTLENGWQFFTAPLWHQILSVFIGLGLCLLGFSILITVLDEGKAKPIIGAILLSALMIIIYGIVSTYFPGSIFVKILGVAMLIGVTAGFKGLWHR